MPDDENEKILGAAVDVKLIELFDEMNFQVFGRKFTKKKLISNFAKWWISLPIEEKKAFYNQSDEQESLSLLIHRIVEQKMNTFYAEDLEQEAGLEEIEQLEESPAKFRNLLRNARKKTMMVERKLSEKETQAKALRETVARQKKELSRLKATGPGRRAKPSEPA